MFQLRTFKTLAILIAIFVVLLLPASVWPGYLDSPVGIVLAMPYLSIYLFHFIGIPGLLVNNGMCGWGWCPPTLFGWAFLCSFWFLLVWLLAWGIASLSDHSNSPPNGTS